MNIYILNYTKFSIRFSSYVLFSPTKSILSINTFGFIKDFYIFFFFAVIDAVKLVEKSLYAVKLVKKCPDTVKLVEKSLVVKVCTDSS